MIRWERLGALAAPVGVIVGFIAIVRGAWMFDERWGWVALGVALLLVTHIVDKNASPDHDDQQTQVLTGGPRGAIR